MPQVDFLTFAGGSGANVVAQATYAGSGTQVAGFGSGVVPSNFFNKPVRQMSIMAAVMANLIAQQTGADVIDDGTTSTITTNFVKAVKILGGAPQYVNSSVPVGYSNYEVDTSAGPFTLTLPASPPTNTVVEFQDATLSWAKNPLTVARNGATIAGQNTDLICNIAGYTFRLLFTGSDWRFI